MIVDEGVFLEHYGVPGMKWGKRKAASVSRNRQLNKLSRTRDKIERDNSIDAARERVKSGAVKKERKEAKAQYKKDKIDVGSREARKILYEKREALAKEVALSREAKSGKEAVKAVMVEAGGIYLQQKIKSSSSTRTTSRPSSPPPRRNVVNVTSRVVS